VSAPLHVTDRARPPQSLLAEIERDGWIIEAGFELPRTPWDLTDRRWVRWGTVSTEEQIAPAVMAAARGVGVVAGCADRAVMEQLCDDLSRIGRLERLELGPDPLDQLDDEQRALLGSLASGASIGEAADALFLSTRTAERRLAAARRTLGVRTTAEAIALVTT
jgi:DNA-binding CsgD family transcriptional regulator